jgi:dTDP-glucose 4,6-dehydratase
VTGGAGFIGTNFIYGWRASQRGRVINFDKLTYAGNASNFDGVRDSDCWLVVGDIADRKAVETVLQQHRPCAIVNFAAESHVDRSIHGPAEFITTNVVGTLQVLEAIRSHLDRLPSQDRATFRLVHISTDEVFGSLDAEDPPFFELTRYAPNSPYAASKAASDHLVRAWHHTYDLPTLTVNSSNNYGPYQFPEKLIPLMIHHALGGQPLPVYGDGQHVRDWVFVADCCRAIERVLQHGRVGECYTIGGRSEKTNRQVVETICDELDRERPRHDGKSYRQQIAFVRDRPGHDRRYAIDCSKIERELGWKPQETFATGIRKTVRWYLDHPEWVERVTSGRYRDWIERNYSSRK